MKKRPVAGLNIALLDILTGALGAVIILYVAVPKGHSLVEASADQDKAALAEQGNQKKTSASSTPLQVVKENKEYEEKKLSKPKQVAQEGSNHSDKYRGKGLPVDVGFKFKGKNIVFIIDVSGSMVREDRIGQVKAGLKMLVTSMSSDYSLDIVHFPAGGEKLFRPLWGQLRKLESYQKNEIYRFLLSLKARGYTPTRAALIHVLKEYKDLSDIVLLTDGAPTKRNSSQEASISQLLLDIDGANKEKVRINTIGVGTSFVKNKGSKAYVFLKELAKDHGGFFYGF